MSIDLSKTYRTRDGRAVTVLQVWGHSRYPIAGEMDGVPMAWTSTGSYYDDGRKDARDLVEITEPKESHHVD